LPPETGWPVFYLLRGHDGLAGIAPPKKPDGCILRLCVKPASTPCWHISTQRKGDMPHMMIGFKNTHNQTVYVNPAQVLYVGAFEEDVSIIAMALAVSGGKPLMLHVRGSVDLVQQKLSGTFPPRS
jgi:hypothetical protein